MKLYSYWRSSAAYRIRIVLNLKGLDYETVPVDLVQGVHKTAEYQSVNPESLVPTLVYEGLHLSQSLAIMEFLDERFPEVSLLPEKIELKAATRALSQIVACDIHPLNNLRVLKYLVHDLKVDSDAKNEWYSHWIAQGFSAFESRLGATAGDFCVGDAPTMADACLMPQIYNARRFEVDLSPYPRIRDVEANCNTLQAFVDAFPENQPDAT